MFNPKIWEINRKTISLLFFFMFSQFLERLKRSFYHWKIPIRDTSFSIHFSRAFLNIHKIHMLCSLLKLLPCALKKIAKTLPSLSGLRSFIWGVTKCLQTAFWFKGKSKCNFESNFNPNSMNIFFIFKLLTQRITFKILNLYERRQFLIFTFQKFDIIVDFKDDYVF